MPLCIDCTGAFFVYAVINAVFMEVFRLSTALFVAFSVFANCNRFVIDKMREKVLY